MDDSIKDSRARFAEAKAAMSHIHAQMKEDFAFSDPSNPQQWDNRVRGMRERDNRPCMTFDQTNQYMLQVVNDGRQNKPEIKVRGVDSASDPKVAEALQGIIRHIEDTSRADIAYDTALENGARVGLGWIRVLPEISNPSRNEQEIRIKRVFDPLSVVLDAGSTEPDGSDAMYGYVETRLTHATFGRMYPKATLARYESSDTWYSDDGVTVCEEFVVEEDEEDTYIVAGESGRMELSKDDYDTLSKRMGQPVPYLNKYKAKRRSVTWRKISGVEELESTTFPASYIPLVPVIGNESWIDGKRWLCGMVRRMMDPARAYNYERSAYIEMVALQPKAPYVGPIEAFEGIDAWQTANTINHSYLPYNSVDDDGKPVNEPKRQNPPSVSSGFAQGAMMARDDLQASIGMYRSNLGAPSNAISGRAKLQDQREGDTATFHYIDNLARSIRHVGRIVLEMIPKIYDTKRVQRILGEDGEPSQIVIDPKLEQAAVMPQAGPGQKPQLVINPSIGEYDVTVSSGPAYSTRRQETAEALANLIQGNPQMFTIVGDVLAKMQDWPQSEKIAARLHAMLPPQILAAEQHDDPQAAAMQQQMQKMQQELQQAQQMAQMATEKLKQKDGNEQQRLNIDAFEAETARMVALAPAIPPDAVQAIVMQTLQALMGQPNPEGKPQMPQGMNGGHMPQGMMNGAPVGMPQGPLPQGPLPQQRPPMPPQGPPQGMPMGMPPQQPQAPQGAFLTPSNPQ